MHGPTNVKFALVFSIILVEFVVNCILFFVYLINVVVFIMLCVPTEYVAIVVEDSSKVGSIPASYVEDSGFKQYL